MYIRTLPLLIALVCVLSLCLTGTALSGTDEKIIFLHHSTGAGVYNGGNVPAWFDAYNQTNGTAYDISERSYPTGSYPWANYPYDYWNLWINGVCNSDEPSIECMNTLVQKYDVIIFKHCYPGAGIAADTGSPDVTSSAKRLENYKLQYRALRAMMDAYPDTVFIIWTLAPLHRLSSTPEQAARAAEFVDWVTTDFLTEDGVSHPNIRIFDFWANVAETAPAPALGETNHLRYDYERSHNSGDSHPNDLANETVGPVFAQFIVDAIRPRTQARLAGPMILLLE